MQTYNTKSIGGAGVVFAQGRDKTLLVRCDGYEIGTIRKDDGIWDFIPRADMPYGGKEFLRQLINNNRKRWMVWSNAVKARKNYIAIFKDLQEDDNMLQRVVNGIRNGMFVNTKEEAA